MILSQPILDRPLKRRRLQVVCAWCDGPPPKVVGEQVTHGICRQCAMRFFGIDPEQAAPR